VATAIIKSQSGNDVKSPASHHPLRNGRVDLGVTAMTASIRAYLVASAIENLLPKQ